MEREWSCERASSWLARAGMARWGQPAPTAERAPRGRQATVRCALRPVPSCLRWLESARTTGHQAPAHVFRAETPAGGRTPPTAWTAACPVDPVVLVAEASAVVTAPVALHTPSSRSAARRRSPLSPGRFSVRAKEEPAPVVPPAAATSPTPGTDPRPGDDGELPSRALPEEQRGFECPVLASPVTVSSPAGAGGGRAGGSE